MQLTVFHAALVQIMAWRRLGDKPLSGPIIVRSLAHIYVPLNLNELNWYKMGDLHINMDNIYAYVFHVCVIWDSQAFSLKICSRINFQFNIDLHCFYDCVYNNTHANSNKKQQLIKCRGTKLWNQLPHSIRMTERTLKTFAKHVKERIISSYYYQVSTKKNEQWW